MINFNFVDVRSHRRNIDLFRSSHAHRYQSCPTRASSVESGHHRPSASRACSNENPDSSTPAAFEDLLHDFLEMDDQALRRYASKEHKIIPMDFLLWLNLREEQAVGKDRQALDSLGGKLTALKEGIDPAMADQMSASVRDQGGAHPAMEEADPFGKNGSMEMQIQRRKHELARRRALESTSLPQMMVDQSKAEDFAKELQKRRAASTAELIGRAPVVMAQAQKGLNAATAADRILEALLSIEDRDERLAMVPEAFVPPQESTAGADMTEELIYTSPLRLLQAVLLALQKLPEGKSSQEGGAELREEGSLGLEDKRAALLDIKKTIFLILEDENG